MKTRGTHSINILILDESHGLSVEFFNKALCSNSKIPFKFLDKETHIDRVRLIIESNSHSI